MRDYLHAYPHFIRRLNFFHGQVTDLWGHVVAENLYLKLEHDPEDVHPTLVVFAVAAAVSPEDDAEGTLELFRVQLTKFGAWPDGIGFTFVIVDSLGGE